MICRVICIMWNASLDESQVGIKIARISIYNLRYADNTTPKTESEEERASAKSLQSCLILCHPIDGSPPGSAIPGILQARTLEWLAISFSKEPLDEGKRGEWKSWLKTEHSKTEDHGIQSHHFMANTWGNNGNSDRLYFLGLQNHCRWWLQP